MKRLLSALRAPAGRAPVVLALAAALGIVLPARRLQVDPPPRFGKFPEVADRLYGPLRPQLRPGERIGLVLASGDPNVDGGIHYSAQYALVPALVEPIYVGECLRPERGPRCRLEAVQRVAYAPRDPAALAFVEERLGLQRTQRLGPLFVLERRR